MNRRLKWAAGLSVVLIVSALSIFALYSRIPVTCEPSWKGNGSALIDIANWLDWYNHTRSLLEQRFGAKLVEFGRNAHADEMWLEWIVLLRNYTLTQQDIDFLRNVFPDYVTVQIWIDVRDALVMTSYPPVIQTNC